MLAEKVKHLGLVDLCAHREGREWQTGGVDALIDQTPDGGEIFIVGRSLAVFANEHQRLITAISERGLRCTFVMADATAEPELKSLVKDDYAETDFHACWVTFQKTAAALGSISSCRGSFELYGIPAFVPETFAAHEREGGVKFCTLEVGIGVGSGERPSVYFIKTSEHDVYTHMNKIFRSILSGREPLLRVLPHTTEAETGRRQHV
jgi:hypothetical protein